MNSSKSGQQALSNLKSQPTVSQAEDDDEIKNFKIKISLVGDEGVGKSTIAMFICRSYFQQQYRKTLGCDFYLKNMTLPGRNQVNLQLWDVSAHALTTKMLDHYLFGSNIILFVYDITNRDSFIKINTYLKAVKNIMGSRTYTMGLVGNKTDLYHLHTVKMQEHAEFCESNKLKSFFMSPKTGDQVNDCFMTLCSEITGVALTKSKIAQDSVNLSNTTSRVNKIEEGESSDENEDDDDEEEKQKEVTEKKQPASKPVSTPQKNQNSAGEYDDIKKAGNFSSPPSFNKGKGDSSGPAKQNTGKSKNCLIF